MSKTPTELLTAVRAMTGATDGRRMYEELMELLPAATRLGAQFWAKVDAELDELEAQAKRRGGGPIRSIR